MSKYEFLQFSQDQAKLCVRPFYKNKLHVINYMIMKFDSSLQNVIFEKEKEKRDLLN